MTPPDRDRRATSICGFCSTGCSLTVVDDGRSLRVTPTVDYPVNRGTACPKGWEALAPLRAPDRATSPLVRSNGKLVPVSWDAALGAFVDRMKAIQARHGNASIAFLGTGQIATEELAFLGALAKFGMGLVHGDGNTRQCMATSVVAYKEAFGFDAPPYTYRDLEQSDTLVLWGANPCIAHPILWERVCRNPHRPAIVVVDPRRTETAMAATHHYALRPKSDLALLYGVARVLFERGWIDERFIERHTSGCAEFRAHVEAFPAERVAAETGVSVGDVHALAETIHRGERVSFWWTMGVNQSHEGVRVAQAIINLALMTGNIGRPGTGANSITGQCNAMGSRLFSNTTNLLGGRDFTDRDDRASVARALGIDEQVIPDRPSLAYDQILEAILAGKIVALWIVATNPAHSWINQRDLHDVLGRLKLLVVQDMYANTETAERADILFPAAGWGEKDGTFINSERRIARIRKLARAPGQALPDFDIFRLVAERWGCGRMFAEWTDPEAVFRILQRVSRGQPCDISGIDGYRMLDERGGVQWPFSEAGSDSAPERRLYEDGRFFHDDGRARFRFEAPRPAPEPTSSKYPLLLLTGRGSSSQWHTQTRTIKSAVLRRLHPRDVYVEICSVDARARGIAFHEWVVVESRRAQVRARAFVTHTVRPGQVFMPMHYPETNRLTLAAFDPYSRQPSYKACAVEIRRPEPWERRGEP